MGLLATIRNAYTWLATPVPDPSTGNQAFQWFQELPQANVFTPGLVPFKQFQVLGAPQVVVNNTQTQAGVGGLQAGQFISQGLIDESTNSGSATWR